MKSINTLVYNLDYVKEDESEEGTAHTNLELFYYSLLYTCSCHIQHLEKEKMIPGMFLMVILSFNYLIYC